MPDHRKPYLEMMKRNAFHSQVEDLELYRVTNEITLGKETCSVCY